jgi:lauroyl/myristoyl acyltransferase
MRFRSKNDVRIFSGRDSWKIIDFLKNGGILGMLVDGNDLDSRYETAERISRLAGVPMMPFIAHRNDGGACLKINCGFEKVIDKRPWDYMWFYRSRA